MLDENLNRAKTLMESVDVIFNNSKETDISLREINNNIEVISDKTNLLSDDSRNSSIEVEKNYRKVVEALSKTQEISKETRNLQETSSNSKNEIENAINEIEKIAEYTDKTKSSFNQLIERSREIENILQEIQSIAKKTNLLSINASIEASKAGEAGRGFAVVAMSIKNLAEKSSGYAENISNVLEAIKSDSETAEKSLNNTHTVVLSGIENINRVSNAFSEMESIQDKTIYSLQDIIAHMEDIGISGKEIEDRINSLKNSNETISEKILHIVGRIGNLSKKSEENYKYIEDIKVESRNLCIDKKI